MGSSSPALPYLKVTKWQSGKPRPGAFPSRGAAGIFFRGPKGSLSQTCCCSWGM